MGRNAIFWGHFVDAHNLFVGANEIPSISSYNCCIPNKTLVIIQCWLQVKQYRLCER